MRRVLKGLSLSVCMVLILALGIFAGAHLFLKTDAGAEQIIKLINNLIPGKISGGDIQLSLLDQSVSMRDAKLDGPDGQTIVRAERLRLAMDLPALSRGDLIFKAIQLEHPIGSLMIDADGRFNIEKAFVEKPSQKSKLSVLIYKLTCQDGDLDFRGPDGKAWVRLKKFNLAFDAAFATDIIMHLAVPTAQASLIVGSRTIDCGTSSLSGTISNDRVQDILFTSQKNTSRIVIKGSVDDLARKARLRGTAALDLELADFRPGLGLPATTRGRISGSLSVSGAYDNPSLACDLAYGGGDVGGYPLGPVQLKGALADRMFTCKELAIPMAGGMVRAAGTLDLRQVFPHGYKSLLDKDKASYSLTMSATGLRLNEIHKIPQDVRGILRSDMVIQGRGITPKAMNIQTTFRANVSDFTVRSLIPKTALDGDGRVDYSGGRLILTPMTIRMNGGALTTRGQVELASQAMAGTMDLQIVEIGRFLPPYSAKARGALSGTAKLSGTLNVPQADIMLSGQACAWQDVALGTIHMESRLDKTGMLSLNQCRIQNQASRIDSFGRVQLFRGFPHIDPDLAMTMTAQLQQVTPHDFIPAIPMGGGFTGQVTASGSQHTLAGAMTLKGDAITYGAMPLGGIDINARLKDGLLTIDQAGLVRGHSVLALTGKAQVLKEHGLAWSPDPMIDLRVIDGRLRLEDFSPHAVGQATLSGSVHGTFKQPVGNLVCEGRGWKLGPQKVSAVDLVAWFEGETLRFDRIAAQIVPGQEIKGTGWINRQGGYALDLAAQGIALEGLDVLKAQAAGLKGKINLTVTGQGNLSHPQLTAHAKIEHILFQEQAFPDGTLDLELREDRVTFKGLLNFAVQGWYDLASSAYQAIAIFDKSDLSPFFGLYGKPRLAGTISGQISAVGTGLGRKGISSIEADLSDLSVSLGRRPLIQADTIKGSYHDRSISIPKTHFRFARGGGFDINAGGTLEQDLVFVAQGDIPVEVIGSVLQGFGGASGNVNISAQATTRNARTAVDALITLKDIRYPIDYNGQQVQAVNGVIRIDNNQVLIDNVTGLLDTGAFTLGGRATLQGYNLARMDVNLHAVKLPVVVPETMDITVDGDMEIKADETRSVLKSDLAITDGTYYRDMDVNLLTGVFSSILRKPRPTSRRTQAIPWPFTPATQLDVNLKRRGPLRVENNIANLDLNPDLRVTGTLGNPIVNGRITVTQGVVTFQKNDFEVTRGAVDFLNPTRTEATVDIESRTKVREWTINLAITGRIDDLLVELSSVPAEEQSDILSLLLIGKTSRELTQNQTGVRVSPSGMVAELIAGTYGKEIKKVTTLDILKVESGDFTTSQTGENLKLTLGKDLTPRLSIQYEVQNSTTGAAQRGIAAYKLLDNVLINGYQGNNGAYGADIQFKYDFR